MTDRNAVTSPSESPGHRPRLMGRNRRCMTDHIAVETGTSERLRHQETPSNKYRIMMLISDTGGGHRSSADALAAAIHIQYPGLCEIHIDDIWTNHGVWPFNTFVPVYRYLCDNPRYWALLYDSTKSKLSQQFINASGYALCGKNFKNLFNEFRPHLVCSVHPLCQDVPLKILADLPLPPIPSVRASNTKPVIHDRQTSCLSSHTTSISPPSSIRRPYLSRRNSPVLKPHRRVVPFVTVVTDLGIAHPMWFHTGVDLCFVPSKPVQEIALAENLKPEQIRLFGLPLRQAFWNDDPRSKEEIRKELGLLPDKPVCLIVGGGDGVGGIVNLTEQLVKGLSEGSTKELQVVAICGKNESARIDLEFKLKKFLLVSTNSSVSVDSNSTDITGESISAAHLQSTRVPRRRYWSLPPLVGSRLINVEADAPMTEGIGTRRLRRRSDNSLDSFSCLLRESLLGESGNGTMNSESSAQRLYEGKPETPQQPDQIIVTGKEFLGDIPNKNERRDTDGFYERRKYETLPILPMQSRDMRRRLKFGSSKSSPASRIYKKTRHIRQTQQFNLAAIERFSQRKHVDKKPSNEASPSLLVTFTDWFTWTNDDENRMGKPILTGVEDRPNIHLVVKGFVNNMADWMGASDLIITKAGPGTIAEACCKGLPVILSCYLPGQEEGNVEFVTAGKFGGYSPVLSEIVVAARELLLNDRIRAAASRRARSAIDRKATLRIANAIVQLMIAKVGNAHDKERSRS